MRNYCRFISSILVTSVTVWGMLFLMPGQAAALTVTPSTWNIIGLDSNTPSFGPNRFPVGARVCDGTPGANDTATLTWDGGGTDNGTYIYLRAGSANPVTFTYGADGCGDAFFEVEVAKNPAAFDQTRRYHITAGGVSTPTPREINVERLVSQSRNAITNMEFGETLASMTSVPNGGSMNLIKGKTYFIRMSGYTATQGYEQLESFVSFPNTIFQILSVNTTYTADTTTHVSSPNPMLYGDACAWENDPDSPNYRACNDEGKIGGTISVTYEVKILSIGSGQETLNSLIQDFSGSSFHYNADYVTSARLANLIDPSLLTISKNFWPDPTNVGGIASLTFTISNPNSGPVGDLNFGDVLPTTPGAMVVADPPNATTNGCGLSYSFTPTAGDDSISFSGGTVAAYSACTVKVNVTPPAAGTYINTSGNLFVGTLDTGDNASDTLIADTTSFPSPAPPAACDSPVELARWSINGTEKPPLFTSKAADVSSATASFNGTTDAISTTQGGTAVNSWYATGWPSTSGTSTAASSPNFQFVVDTSNYGGARISTSYALLASGDWAAGNNNHGYIYSSADGGAYSSSLSTGTLSKGTWQTGVNGMVANAATTGTITTSFRINFDTRNAVKPLAAAYIDDIVVSGCAPPEPPTISKDFSPNPVAVGATSTLTFTITNPNTDTHANYSYTGLAFSDTFPGGLTVATPLASSNTCGGSLLDDGGGALAGGDSGISLSAGTLSPNSTCTVTVAVLVDSGSPGPHDNVSGFVSANEGGANTGPTGVASDSLIGVSPPSIAKQFDANPIIVGNTSTLSFTISNPNQGISLNGVGFTDPFPAAPGAMTVAATPNVTTSGCGAGTFAPVLVGGEAAITFNGATIAAGTTCTVTVDVTAAVSGTYDNTSGNVFHIINAATANGNTASDSLQVKPVNPDISLLKQVSPTAAGPWTSFMAVTTGADVYYLLTVENIGDVPLSPVTVSDPLVDTSGCSWPDPLPAPVAANDDHIATCLIGPITAVAGSNLNTATATGTYAGSPYTDISSATYATIGLTFTKSAAESHFTVEGGALNYSYLVENSGAASLVGPVTVADDKTTASCPAVDTVGDLDNYLDPGEQLTCTAAYTVLATDVTAKSITNVASGTISGVTSATDTVTVPLASDLSVVKSNNVSGVLPVGNAFIWVLTVNNLVAAGDAEFADGQTILTDDLPVSGATYVVGATKPAGTSGTIDCTEAANTLTCSANGTVTIPAALAGTVAVTVDSATVTGSGTAFTTELTAGSIISLSGVPYTVASIINDTELILTVVYAGATAGGLTVPGSFSVPVIVTTTAAGSLVNPNGGGVCQVDPGTLLLEIDETNNDCADTVTVRDLPSLLILKSVEAYSDPINGTTSPKALPGSVMTYTILVTNTGPGSVDDNTTFITDPIPANTELFVGDIGAPGAGPVLFSDGATASGLSYTFTALNDGTDGLSFADLLTAPAYTKADVTADANQCDATVTNLKISLNGIFAASDGTNNPSFTVKFRVRVQ